MFELVWVNRSFAPTILSTEIGDTSVSKAARALANGSTSSSESPISPSCSRWASVLYALSAPSNSGLVARSASTMPLSVESLVFTSATWVFKCVKCALCDSCNNMLKSDSFCIFSWFCFNQYPTPPPAPRQAIPNKAVIGSMRIESSLSLYALWLE